MQGVSSITVVLLVALMVTTEANKHKGHKERTGTRAYGKDGKQGSECDANEWTYGRCVPDTGDCGAGVREATCNDNTKKIECKIPCNWKKDISDCKYRFTNWGECDTATGTKSRSGTLKKVMFNAECQQTVKVSKPCSAKAKKPRGEKKRNGD